MNDSILNNGSILSLEAYRKKARQAAAEGIVLLENRDKALPLVPGSRVALFGRSQFHGGKSGAGAEGIVHTDPATGTGSAERIREAILASQIYVLDPSVEAAYQAWLSDHPYMQEDDRAQELWSQEEMPLEDALVERAAKEDDAAIVILGRTAGGSLDQQDVPGSYLLTQAEETMLQKVCAAFPRTIVLLNVGNCIDMKWVSRYQPAAVLYAWQGGQEGGNAVLDVLTGAVNPSGKLTDTIADDIEDDPSTANFGDAKRNVYREDVYVGYRYFETFAPEKVLYPFGFGRSYTTFQIKGLGMEILGDDKLVFRARVTNTGEMPGKEVIQLYCEAPQGKLGKPVRSLCAYRKTILLDPGQYQDLKLKVPIKAIASYDDSGVTGYRSAWVLEGGEYTFYLGSDVRTAVSAGSFALSGTAPIEQLEEAMAPVTAFERMKPAAEEKSAYAEGASNRAAYKVSYEPVPLRTVDPMVRRGDRMPEEFSFTGDKGIRLGAVETGDAGWGEFLGQCTEEDLIGIMRACSTRREELLSLRSPESTEGTAETKAVFGGVTDKLRSLGIPVARCADEPGGNRKACDAAPLSIPIGTCLACTWNNLLVKDLFEWVGLELRENHIDTLLGPGMNIHRNPLSGRNFESFSEDPFLTGKMAVMQLRGLRESGIQGTIKRFCCDNQEAVRRGADSVVSERALREIYLRGFEIAVKEGAAVAVMTTGGKVNGCYTSSHYDLLTTILRGEWKFGGIVMTDWGAAGGEEGDPGSISQTAPMIRAQNDLRMVTQNAQENANQDNTLEWLAEGRLTRGELQRSALNICRFLLDTSAYLRLHGREESFRAEL